MTWGEPCTGSSSDTFKLSADGMELVQTSILKVNNPPDSCETKYDVLSDDCSPLCSISVSVSPLEKGE